MTTPDTPPEPLPRPAALRPRNQILAGIAVVLAAAVPLALAYGIDLCTILDAVGVELDACARITTPIDYSPEPAPVPGHTEAP
jgi:hypothetical protein